MSEAEVGAGHVALLPDRGVVRVSGSDAAKLLGSLITNDLAHLAKDAALYAGLLSPQGKILFDFIVVPAGDGFLLDVARAKTAELAKRLLLYRLRADVVIEDCSEAYSVLAAWGTAPPPGDGQIAVADPRLAAAGWRVLRPASTVGSGFGDEAAYHAHRIGLGVPEGGRDWDFGDTFPHEALLDQLHGVSFTKGCYVGQEIVSRMEHRGTARKRVVKVVGDAALPADRPEVLAGEVAIGRLGSVAGYVGLALLRLDRVAEALAAGQAVSVAGVPVGVEVPGFATFKLGAPQS